MYLSKLTLNQRSPLARRDMANCHDLHRTLLKAFPALPEKIVDYAKQLGVLFRLEYDRKSGVPLLYVQSKPLPDWANLPKGYLLTEPPAPKLLDAAYAKLQNGTVLSFTLKANPTRTTGSSLKTERLAGQKRNGHRVFIADSDEQISWLRRKGSNGGFELLSIQLDPIVPDVDVNPSIWIYGKRKVESTVAELTFGSTVFRGHLRITEPEVFQQTLRNGIGSGKAYGFGLLSVAPAR